MSKIIGMTIIGLIMLGFFLMSMRAMGWLHWHALWTFTPIFLATVIYVIMVILVFTGKVEI